MRKMFYEQVKALFKLLRCRFLGMLTVQSVASASAKLDPRTVQFTVSWWNYFSLLKHAFRSRGRTYLLSTKRCFSATTLALPWVNRDTTPMAW